MASGEDHNPVCTVVYDSSLTKYKVLVELQVGNGYRVDQEKTLTAPVGTVVHATPEDIAGYHCVTEPSDLSTTATADGNAQIVLRYDQDVASCSICFKTGGSYVAPITGHVGDAVATPEAPTKLGYVFAGWDTNGDSIADALPDTMPGHDVTAEALWTPGEASYEIRYFAEKSGDVYGGSKGYQLIGTYHQTGKTESTTPKARGLDTSKGARFQYYQYSHETSAQIAGDGSTVVNVYYDWKPVKLCFYVIADGQTYMNDSNLIASHTENFAEGLKLPSAEQALEAYRTKYHGQKAHFIGWVSAMSGYYRDEGSGSVTANDVMFDSQGNLIAPFWASFGDNAYHAYIYSVNEGVEPGSYAEENAGLQRRVWDSSAVWQYITDYPSNPVFPYEWRVSTSVWDGNDPSTIEWGSWHKFSDMERMSDGYTYALPSEQEGFDLRKQNVMEVHYARRSYTVTYYVDGQAQASSTYRYGTKFQAGSGVDPSLLKAPDGMVFAGWATRPSSTNYLNGELEMPASNVNLYAQWVHADHLVVFDTHGGTAVDSQTVAWDAKVSEPADPAREGYLFGGWYFYGEGSATPARFSFDMPIEHDLVLHAAWKLAGEKTTYTVVHQAKDGTELSRETSDGLVGETVTAVPLAEGSAARAGYRYVSSSGSTIVLSKDADRNVITFVYDNDPSYLYIIHAVDAATGRDIADWQVLESGDVVVDAMAPDVPGWRVRGCGSGYVGAGGTRELVFLYDKMAPQEEGAAPDLQQGAMRQEAKPQAAVTEASASGERAALPETGDQSGLASPLLAAAGAALAAAGLRGRRRDA